MPSVTSTCHCKAFTQNIDLAGVELPHLDTTCSCSSCRRRTGQLAIFPFPHPSSTFPDNLSSLQHYDTLNSTTGRTVRTYFCGTCGSKIHIQIRREDGSILGGGWMLGCLDTLEVGRKPLIKVHGHSLVEDTIDGGISTFWKKAGGDDLVIYEDGSTDVRDEVDDDRLHVHCRCGGFSAYIPRPNDGSKFRALWCACHSCRITAGSDLPAAPWIELPLESVELKSSSSARWARTSSGMPPEVEGLTLYRSTPSRPHIGRYFCSTCGASVAYLDTSRKAENVAICFGLVDAVDGSLAVRWVDWQGRVGFKEDGLERWGPIVEEFEQGLSDWKDQQSGHS